MGNKHPTVAEILAIAKVLDENDVPQTDRHVYTIDGDGNEQRYYIDRFGKIHKYTRESKND